MFPEPFAALESRRRFWLTCGRMRVRFGDWEFDPEARELRRAGASVELPPKAFQLLVLLIEQRPRPLSHSRLRDALWPDAHVGYTSLARTVSVLRKALGDAAGRSSFVRTVPRYGYAFAARVAIETPAQTPAFALVADDRDFLLHEGEVLVGRGPDCGVRLLASGVSRVHACLRVRESGVRIEDRDSKNGTWVNGTRISAPVELEEGDELTFGAYRLVFRSMALLDSTRTVNAD
jgi:DNA-binding winged helix-turn-helix (wHTH) protein